jgi:hypothetical protein
LTRILAFSPYAAWRVHANYETTITRACQVRGAEVKHILCDGVFAECDVSNSTGTPTGRTAELCRWCQGEARVAIEEAGLAHEWLSRYIEPQEKRAIVAWAQGLRPEEFADSTFHGFPVGSCVRSSMVSYFRTFPIRLDDWQTSNIFRGFLHGAAQTYVGFKHLLEEWQPDALVLFNGRLSMTRVALTLARERGVRVLIHESPRTPGTIFVLENDHVVSAAPVRRFWEAWEGVPLTEAQLLRVAGWLADRRYGRSGPGIFKFATAPQGAKDLKSKLGLQGRKLIALFNSSTDESAGDPDIDAVFPTQEDWIEKVVQWIARRPQWDLVIRTHPCLAGQIGISRAQSQIEWFNALRSRLPANARVVMPDDPLSAYDLMDAADVGLTYGSTAGIEMFALGKPVVAIPGYAIYADAGVPGLILTDDPATLDRQMDRAMELTATREFQRAAFRYLYRYYFHMQMAFPLVSMVDQFESRVNYDSPEALKAGSDPVLDRICAFLLEGKPIFVDPDNASLQLTTEDEDEFFDRIASDPEWLKSVRSEVTATVVPTGVQAEQRGLSSILLYSLVRLLRRGIPERVRVRLRQAWQSSISP